MGLVDGANELIDKTDFSVTAGNKWVDNDGSLRWETPLDPQDCMLTVMIYDAFGSLMDSKSTVVNIEPEP